MRVRLKDEAGARQILPRTIARGLNWLPCRSPAFAGKNAAPENEGRAGHRGQRPEAVRKKKHGGGYEAPSPASRARCLARGDRAPWARPSR